MPATGSLPFPHYFRRSRRGRKPSLLLFGHTAFALSPFFDSNLSLSRRSSKVGHGVRGPRLLDLGRGYHDGELLRDSESAAGEGDSTRCFSPRLWRPWNRHRHCHDLQPGRRRPCPRDFLCDLGVYALLAGFLLHARGLLCVQGVQGFFLREHSGCVKDGLS